LQGALEADLETDVVAVNLYGPRADMQFLRAVLTGITLRHQDHHLELPVGEIVEVMIVGMQCADMLDHGVECVPGNPGVEIEFASQDFFQGFRKVTHGVGFVDVSHSPGPQASLGIEFLTMGRVDEDFQMWVERGELFDEFKAVTTRELNIQDHEVRLIPFQLGHRLLGGRAGPDNLPAASFFDEVSQPDTRRGLAIDNCYALPLGRSRCFWCRFHSLGREC
jgi:hypothetical protein